MANDTIAAKLSAARTQLIIDHPFLGALVLRLPLIKANPRWCTTTATDARKIYYNEQYIESLSLPQTQFMLAHEALHCGLLHFTRRAHRITRRWDIACDFAINPLLIREGLKAPPNSLHEESFKGMTAEEIYPHIRDNTKDKPLDQHIYNNNTSPSQSNEMHPSQRPQGHDQPKPLQTHEREDLSTQWQQRLASAAQQAQLAGKLHGEIQRLVNFILQPQTPWRVLLAQFMTSIARDDYTYTRPSTRRGDPAIFPSLRSTQTNIVVTLDTSGSISKDEMSIFIAEIDAIKAQVRARITLHACDAKLNNQGPWIFEAWENFTLPKPLRGGGGSRFTPIFTWIEQQDQYPDLLVYLTDAEGQFPPSPPEYSVIWLVKGKAKVPWGQRIQLN